MEIGVQKLAYIQQPAMTNATAKPHHQSNVQLRVHDSLDLTPKRRVAGAKGPENFTESMVVRQNSLDDSKSLIDYRTA